MLTAKCKIKVYERQNQINLTHLYIYSVETFALILHSNIAFKKLFWLKLSILNHILYALNPLIPDDNTMSHILKQA